MFRYTIKDRKMITKEGTYEPRRVAVQVNAGRITLDALAREIADDTSLGRGDVKSVLLHLAVVVGRYACMGYSVDLGELGTLTPRLSAASLSPEEEYTADAIRAVRLRYTPSMELKRRLSAVTFERQEEQEEGGEAPDPVEPEEPEEDPDLV